MATVLAVLALFAAAGCDRTPLQLPACDASATQAELMKLLTTHPQIAPLLAAPPKGIVDVRETRFAAVPQVSARTFLRLCAGTLQTHDGAQAFIGWQIFTTDTVFGNTWGLGACIEGRFHDQDCRAYAEGRMPGEPKLPKAVR